MKFVSYCFTTGSSQNISDTPLVTQFQNTQNCVIKGVSTVFCLKTLFLHDFQPSKMTVENMTRKTRTSNYLATNDHRPEEMEDEQKGIVVDILTHICSVICNKQFKYLVSSSIKGIWRVNFAQY